MSSSKKAYRKNLFVLCALLLALHAAACVSSAMAQGASSAPEYGVYLVVTASQKAWTSVFVDGRHVFEETINVGQTVSWRGKKHIYFVTGNAGGVQLMLNGQALPPLGEKGRVVKKRFTASDAPAKVPTQTKATPEVVPLAPERKPEPKATPEPAPEPQPTPAPRIQASPPQEPVERANDGNIPSDSERYPITAYANIALLATLLIATTGMLVTLRRERKLTPTNGFDQDHTRRSVRIVASQELASGKTIHVFDVDGRLFLLGTGGVELLGEVGEDPNAGRSGDASH